MLLNSSGYHSLFIFEPAYRKKNHFSEKLHLEGKELKELVGLIERMKFELEIPNNELSVTGLFMQIAGFILRNSHRTENFLGIENPGKKIIDYIDKNLSEQISLKDLAKFSGMSKNGTVSMFYRLYGITPIKYINNARLARAELLLKTTDKSITELALECGFNDSNYFSRAFKSYSGKTPREFRKDSKR